ncbi:MAG: polyprenyl synthetase family protein [Geodermatophilaceae bacterium]|nr:polyprenyl synthetase family protein [Geodermatophilaceae bacterium]
MTDTQQHPVGSIDGRLSSVLDGLPDGLQAACRRIVFAGGKRSRAGLVAATAAAAGEEFDRADLEGCAAAIELLHCATLVHDDLIDAATTRRGAPTINAREGTTMAVLAGDALIGAAARLAIQVSREAGLILAEALQSLCAGQAMEEFFRFDPSLTEPDALAVVEGKTASLLQAACLLGVSVGGGSEALREALARYGTAFGMALQLVDDVLDLTSTEVLFGKPVAVDFVSGTLTLPALAALPDQPRLRALFRPGLSAGDQRSALRLLRCGPGVAWTVQRAEAYAAEARHSLNMLPDGTLGFAELADRPSRYVARQLQELVHPTHRHLLALP